MQGGSLHVVFSCAGAEHLRDALASPNRRDSVVALPDEFNLGPIDVVDPIARKAWMADFAGDPDYDVASNETFWRSALSSETVPIAWFSRYSAYEYAGFLEWLWRIGGAPCKIVDLTESKPIVRERQGEPPPFICFAGLGDFQPADIVRGDLLQEIRPLSVEERSRYHKLWSRLKKENAPVRIIEQAELCSAPLSRFDSLLLAIATQEWQKMARMVADALFIQIEEGVNQIGDGFLAARIRALAAMGQLELRGDISAMRTTEVRRGPSSVI